jgi:hypothetical protein
VKFVDTSLVGRIAVGNLNFVERTRIQSCASRSDL